MKKFGLSLLSLVPALFLIVAVYPSIQASAYQVMPVVLGILAYSFMLNALFLASRPNWVSRWLGMTVIYRGHMAMGIGTVVLAILHKSFTLTQEVHFTTMVGFFGLVLLVVIGLFSMLFLNGDLKAHVAWIRQLNRKLAGVLPHRRVMVVHRLNLVAILLIFCHVSSMAVFRQNVLFYVSFVLLTLVAVISFIHRKVKVSRVN